jgi:N-carbamoylputrescine amidase
MKIAYVQWPDGLMPETPAWDLIRARVREAAPDLLITNEMPFGSWLPVHASYDAFAASDWVEQHEQGLAALKALGCAVISSRPVHAGSSLANEAFALEKGLYSALHHKHYFPAEPGWQEAAWFAPAQEGFAVHTVAGIRVGVLLCTELMFNEHARRYVRDGRAQLIVSPRASGQTLHTWHAAGAMAAIVSGAYVISSNRVGQAQASDAQHPQFGGEGFAYAPGGKLIQVTSFDSPMQVILWDETQVMQAQQDYPCYVQELR